MASKHKSSKRKGKRKSNGEFSEKRNHSLSPDGKNLRIESIEGDEDEVLIALNMVEQMNERLDQVLFRLGALEKKLEKLETIEVKLQEVNATLFKLESNVSNLQGETAQLKAKHDETDKLAHKLKRSVELLNGFVEQADEDLNNLKTQHNLEISSLNRKFLYLEAYSRRENLNIFSVFFGPNKFRI